MGAAMDPDAPILIFDSGVGGLSVLAEIRKALPNAPIVYAADSAGFPYGTKSEEDLAQRVPVLLARLRDLFNPRLVVIACNTASTIALDHARANLDIPVVGTVPAIKPAAEQSRSRVIGVLGTEATVRQPYVDDLAGKFAGDCTLVRHGSPELVELAERKIAGEPISIDDVAAALAPMRAAPGAEAIDTLVLSCTHFPLLAAEIAAAWPGVRQVDGSAGIALRVAYLTRGQQWPRIAPTGIGVFTAQPRPGLARALRRYGLGEIQVVEMPEA